MIGRTRLDSHRRTCWSFLFPLVFSLLVAPENVSAQVVDINDENWVYRYDIFQAFLQRAGLTPTASMADIMRSPEESTVILIGDVRRESIGSWLQVKQFVDAGGKVLIAPDNFHSTVYFGEILPGPIKASAEDSKFSGFDDCVRITRFRTTHPLVADIKELVTNRSGAIRRSGLTGDWMQLAFLPDDSLPREFAGKSILGIGETQTDGGVVILSDPSVVSNGMFPFGDNGRFTSQLANYLASGNRSQLFMAVDNSPVQSIPGLGSASNIPQQSDTNADEQLPADPQFQTLLEVANSAIQELANPEDLNNRLKDQPRNINKRQYIIFIISAMTFLVLLWVLSILLSRSNRWLKYKRSTRTVTAETMLRNSYPGDIKNRIASEILAREFSRQWTGLSSVAEWRQWLDDIKHLDRDHLPSKDRVALESLLAIAVFGGKTPMPDQELAKLSQQICELLQRYRQDAKLVCE